VVKPPPKVTFLHALASCFGVLLLIRYNNRVTNLASHWRFGRVVATLKKLWTRWKAVAQVLADFQARLLLTLFYFIIVTPFGFFVRAFSDPLAVKRAPEHSMWSPKELQEPTLDDARRQF
jgi:uncharacterized membrane protein